MAVPEPVLTNDDLAKMVDTNDEWIRGHSGIRERRIARENEYPSTLAVAASLKALEVANLKPTDLDLTMLHLHARIYLPATACIARPTEPPRWRLRPRQLGFYLPPTWPPRRSAAGRSRTRYRLETLSRFVNWKDRNTCILFEMAPVRSFCRPVKRLGVFSLLMHSDGPGRPAHCLEAAADPATEATIHDGKHYIHMDGKALYRLPRE
jgi:3-oxoacyl-[acyl-carrier-protein] synthase-3